MCYACFSCVGLDAFATYETFGPLCLPSLTTTMCVCVCVCVYMWPRYRDTLEQNQCVQGIVVFTERTPRIAQRATYYYISVPPVLLFASENMRNCGRTGYVAAPKGALEW